MLDGKKTEFRKAYSRGRKPAILTDLPCPVGLYALNHARVWQAAMFVVETMWRERVMAITSESLSREGFDTLDDWKRYWMLRTGSRINPLEEVTAYRVHPLVDPDEQREYGWRLLTHIYAFVPR